MDTKRDEKRELITGEISHLVIEEFPDPVHVVDSDGNIVLTNRTAEALLGYSREELLKMNIRDMYVDKLFPAPPRESERPGERVLRDRNGQHIPVEVHSFSIHDEKSRPVHTVSILRDLRQVKERQQELIQTERLAAIGELAAGIVHDINDPLSVINMCAQLMKKAIAAPDTDLESERAAWEERVADINRAAGAIHNLMTRLRNFARGVADERERIDLCSCVQDALILVGGKINKTRVRAAHELEVGRFYTLGSPHQMVQIFANLISNACDALEACDTREIRTTIEPCFRNGALFWKCSVHDTGPGIPPARQREIFESFVTTKPKGQGPGLGLSIVRQIVSDHEGEIEVVSSPGKGSTFSVYLHQAGTDTPVRCADDRALVMATAE